MGVCYVGMPTVPVHMVYTGTVYMVPYLYHQAFQQPFYSMVYGTALAHITCSVIRQYSHKYRYLQECMTWLDFACIQLGA